MEIENRKMGWAGNANNVVDLCDDSDDEVVSVPRRTASVHRWPSPRRRKRPISEIVELTGSGDEDSDPDEENVSIAAPGQRQRQKNDNSSSEVRVVKTQVSLPLTPLQQVLEIFPDVEITHAQKLLKENSNIATSVISILAENVSYPKEPKKKRQAPTTGAAAKRSSSNEPTYDFMSSSSFQPSQDYIKGSTDQLAADFPFLTKKGASALLGKAHNHYAIAHDKICRGITGKDEVRKVASLGSDEDVEESQYKKLKAVMSDLQPIDSDQTNRLSKLFDFHLSASRHFCKNRKRRSSSCNNPILVEEIAFVRTKLQEWFNEVELQIARKITREESIRDGTAVECSCCFDQVAIEEMVACRDEGHLFCSECLSQYVVSQVFANGNFGINPKTKEQADELLCCHSDGCSSGFERAYLEKALKSKILQKYDELTYRVSVEKAGLRDNMWYVRCLILPVLGSVWMLTFFTGWDAI
jgi:hypothetical protein